MPRKNLDEHFESERPEWTKRKHGLLERYVRPAAMKMRKMGGTVVLVDGFAGANSYGTELTGSTAIMVRAARAVVRAGSEAVVYACEPDPGRFNALASNLSSDIADGLLRVFNQAHAEALPAILKEIGLKPTIVFLDPQTVTQMTL